MERSIGDGWINYSDWDRWDGEEGNVGCWSCRYNRETGLEKAIKGKVNSLNECSAGDGPAFCLQAWNLGRALVPFLPASLEINRERWLVVEVSILPFLFNMSLSCFAVFVALIKSWS